jgi:hypothetical protein
MSWKNEKRRLKAAAWEVEQEKRAAEQRRKDDLSMWERIEEADLHPDLKDILHRLANGEREE